MLQHFHKQETLGFYFNDNAIVIWTAFISADNTVFSFEVESVRATTLPLYREDTNIVTQRLGNHDMSNIQGFGAIKYMLDNKLNAQELTNHLLPQYYLDNLPFSISDMVTEFLDSLINYSPAPKEKKVVRYFNANQYNTTTLTRATPQSAAFDLCANISENLTIPPSGQELVSTGLYVALDNEIAMLLLPRSGNAAKYSVTLTNSPGLIDPDYRGEVKVIVINHGDKDFVITPGARIAQAVFIKIIHPSLLEVLNKADLENTERGIGGFGSTGF